MRPFALLTLLLAPSIFACDLNVRAVPADAPSAIAWDRYIGANAYRVTESRDDFVTSRSYLTLTPSFTIPHRVSEPTLFSYRVDALFDENVQIDGACRGELKVTLAPDPQFRAMTRRVIVPIAGSVVGATGAKFRTSLRLTSTSGSQHGRIVFHPAGVASNSDPSIRYSFTAAHQTKTWDDIVESIGAAGSIGAIDVVPDDDADPASPIVLARHYTDAATGTFGAFEPAVAPFDYLTPPAMLVTVPDSRFRLNLGFRTLTDTTVQALIYDKSGQLRALKTATYPADYVTLFPASQLVGEVNADESFTLVFSGGVIPFYTLTDNGTNDPAVVIPRATASRFIE